MRIAIIGSGITGLSAAWLMGKHHEVSLFEAEARAGGHSNTVVAKLPDGDIPVDTGFIVYNEPSYPNLTALFAHLNIATAPSCMTFAASMQNGGYEYAGGLGARGFFGQLSNVFKLGHWRLLKDAIRFSSTALTQIAQYEDQVSLGEFLQREKFGPDFIDRHILPMGAAIWSTPPEQMMAYPARSFINFFANHGLLRLTGHNPWRTVKGGSREYVQRVLADSPIDLRLSCPVHKIERLEDGVNIASAQGLERFDRVLIATHSDQALRLLADADQQEKQILGHVPYCKNLAILHQDERLMPKRKAVWSSWNFIGRGPQDPVLVSYWMNSLQPLATKHDLFVTLNPPEGFVARGEVARFEYEHPNFNAAAMQAQRDLWRIQGRRHTWFAGAWCGSGFHEDGLQAGLAAAEALSGVRRPWEVENESGRIHLEPKAQQGETAAPLPEAAE